jgi:hypothetical protein
MDSIVYHNLQIAQINDICSLMEVRPLLKSIHVTFIHTQEGFHCGNPKWVYVGILRRFSAFRNFERGEIYVATTHSRFAIEDSLLRKLKGVDIEVQELKDEDNSLESERHAMGKWTVSQ